MKTSNEIWVICDKIIKHNLSLIFKARSMANVCKGRVRAVTFYDNDPAECIAAGADEVYLLEGLSDNEDDAVIAQILADMIGKDMPGVVLFQAIIRGRGIASSAAALLKTGLTADCIDLAMDESGLLLQKRPAFGNSIMAEIICDNLRPQMATVRPGVFEAPVLDKKRSGNVIQVPINVKSRIERTGFVPSQDNDVLTDATIIIAGGAGIGSREGFKYLQKIAKHIGGCIGASRAAVDAGFAPYTWQIGQTGVVVRPRLYIAVGISGAVQHLAGMSTADYIVAINTDEGAPIFHYADYGIVGDWINVMDHWIVNYNERKEHGYEL